MNDRPYRVSGPVSRTEVEADEGARVFKELEPVGRWDYGDLEATHRALLALSQCNELIFRAATEQELLEGICRVIVHSAGYRMAWVGRPQATAEHPMVPVAQFGDRGYLRQVQVAWKGDRHGNGPTGKAMRTGQTVLTNDNTADSSFAPWQLSARQYGYRSSVALPLRVAGEVDAVLGIYSDVRDAFDGREVALLERLAANLGYGMEGLRRAERFRRREWQFRQNEAGFRATFEHAPVGIAHADLGRIIVHANDRFCQMLGYEREELLGMSLVDITHPDDIGHDLQRVSRLRGGQCEGLRGEKRYIRRDGEIVWSNVTVALVRDENGEPSYYVGVVEDITDRKQAVQALERSAAEWSYAMDHFEDAIYLVDMDDRLVRANRSFYELTGLSPESAIGRDITQLIHPDGEVEPCPVCRARRERRDAYVTMEAEHPDNPTGRPVEVAVRIIRDRAGDPVGVLKAIRDLTRTRQTEERIGRLNAHVRLLTESVGEGLFGLDQQGLCTFINRAALEMLGYDRDEVLGRPMEMIARSPGSIGNREADECPPFAAFCPGQVTGLRSNMFWRKDGSSFPAEYSAHSISEGDGPAGAVVVFRNVAQRHAMARRMDYLATHDALTGLINRHEFERQLQDALERAHDSKTTHVLVFIDVDRMRVVNDTCGHGAGDELLKQTVRILQGSVRKSDIVARMGGDQFGVLLTGCVLATGCSTIEALLANLRSQRFSWQEKLFQISGSAGVAALDGASPSVAETISRAETACRLAKEHCRGGLRAYQPDDDAMVRRHTETHWVHKIHEALEQERFVLYAQPIRSVSGVGLSHYEVLIRMVGEEGQLIAPGAFIPAAERFSLMGRIDHWVVTRCFDVLASGSGPRSGRGGSGRDIRLAINLSGQSMSDERLLEAIEQRLGRRQFDPRRITFEITETAAISNLAQASRFIDELRKLGCEFALDDFGSGLSSFAYLKDLHVDYLKIDGSFVADLHENPVNLAMVSSIHQIGKLMGKKTIAEFVESEAVMEVLRSVGVDYAQGYWIGRPEPLDGVLVD
ncbi:MAG: PAS domain S-box protein [Gammaproteobacteria bacterium]